VIVCGLPVTDSAAVVKLAWPLLSRGTELARVLIPSLKVTVPWVTGVPLLVTVAVKVTGWPHTDGFFEEVTVTVVVVLLLFTVCVNVGLMPLLRKLLSPR
jgi:hypothetical protein